MLRRSPRGIRLCLVGRGLLLHRLRFAGEDRFLNAQVDAFHQAQVSRDGVARFQQHHVARHQLAWPRSRAASPPRRTRTIGTASLRSAAMACSARYSCKKPSTANRTTMPPMATVSVVLPSSAEMTAAAIRISTMILVNCSHRIFQGFLPPRSSSSLAPNCGAGAAAPAASLRPVRGRFAETAVDSATVMVCQGTGVVSSSIYLQLARRQESSLKFEPIGAGATAPTILLQQEQRNHEMHG